MQTIETTKSTEELELEALLAGLNEVPPETTVATAAVTADPIEPIEPTIAAADPVIEGEKVAAQETPAATTKKAAKPKKAAAPKKEKAAKEKTPKVEKKADKPKKEPVPRKHYANKADRLVDHLGDKLGDYTVLELQDAALEGDALKAKQDETMAAFKNAGDKVQNRMTFLMEYAAGRTESLNGVIVTALKVLKRDGHLTVGVEGNLLKELFKSYTPDTSKAVGGNTMLALRALKMIKPGEKGEFVPNPDSLYLAKINPMLGL